MKKLVTIILLTATINSLSENMEPKSALRVQDDRNVPEPKEDRSKTMLRLFNAVVKHESLDGKLLIGDGGKAHGHAQIHKVMVDDVNRILGKKIFTYDDRMCRDKSFLMFSMFQDHYNPELDIKKACMMWNAGVDCEPLDKAESYYRKVMKFYES